METLRQMEEVLGKPLQARSLASLKEDKELYGAFRKFICSLTAARDNRHGFLSWFWLLFHSKDFLRNPLCFDEHIYFLEAGSPVFVSTALIASDAHFLKARRNIPGLWLGGFLVNRVFRGKGLGELALQHAEQRLKANMTKEGVKTVRLNLFTHNPRALSLYMKCGYVPFGNLDRTRILLSKKIV